ncbi:MAG: PEP-CTERM sorting domain-containing protein [Kiritimatiellae bacterium]|nr:PEP-CTERM sorting domain-containing protein [Kiritimatiellia bacterium]
MIRTERMDMNCRSQRISLVLALIAILCGLNSIRAAVLCVEAFDSDASGWVAVSDFTDPIYDGSFGNLAGSIKGSLPDQFLPLPRYGGCYADISASSGAFVGNYSSMDDFEGWSFDLFSEDEVPLSLQLIVTPQSGSTFSYAATVPQSIGSWFNIGVPGLYSGAWTGGDEAAFNATLANVSSLQIILRDTTDGPVSFYIDNFSNDYHPSTSVPEPESFLLFAAGAFLVGILRVQKRQNSEGDSELITPHGGC